MKKRRNEKRWKSQKQQEEEEEAAATANSNGRKDTEKHAFVCLLVDLPDLLCTIKNGCHFSFFAHNRVA